MTSSIDINSTKTGGHGWALILVLTATLLAALLVQWPWITNPHAVERDFGFLFWMHRFQDDQLFVNDGLIYGRVVELDVGPWHLIMDNASPGFSLLYQAVSGIISFLLFSKLLIFPLTLLAVYYMYRIGELIGGWRLALVLSLIFLVILLASPTSISTTAGLQRSFSIPLLLGLIYYLMVGWDWAAVAMLILSGVIYPPAFVLGSATYALTLLVYDPGSRWRIHVQWRRSLGLIIALAVVLIVLFPVVVERLPAPQTSVAAPDVQEAEETYTRVFGQSAQRPPIWEDPFYKEGNQGQLFDLFPLVGRGGITLPGMSAIHISVLAFLFFSILVIRRDTWKEVPRVLKRFFAAMWLCFFLSWLALLVTRTSILYLPSRYTEAGLILFMLIVVTTNGRDAAARAAAILSHRPGVLLGTIGVVTIMVSAVTISVNSYTDVEGAVDPTDLGGLLPILVIVLFVLSILVLLRRRKGVSSAGRKIARPLRLTFGLVVISLLTLVSAGYVYAFRPVYNQPSELENKMFAYLATFPKDTLFAGQPPYGHLMTRMIAKRQFIWSCPQANIDFRLESARTYFATQDQGKTIRDFCQACGVDYFVIDERIYSEASISALQSEYAGSYLAPYYDSLNVDMNFFFENVPPDLRLFRQEYFSVYACNVELTGSG